MTLDEFSCMFPSNHSRAYNSLLWADLLTVAEIRAYRAKSNKEFRPNSDFTTIKNCGRKTSNMIVQCLNELDKIESERRLADSIPTIAQIVMMES